MTVIIACLTKDDYAIGSDSGAFTDDTVQVVRTPKVFRLGSDNQILVGGSGSFRAIAVAKKVVVNSVVELSMAMMDVPGDWAMLAVDRTGVFELADGGHLVRFDSNYSSTGSGSDVGIGAVASLYGRRSDARLSARAVVHDALKATINHSPYAAGKIVVLSEEL